MFDRQPSTLDVWSAAQQVAARVLSPADYYASFVTSASARAEPPGQEGGELLSSIVDPASADGRQRAVLRVLLERRVGRGMQGRSFANADELVEMCKRHGMPQQRGGEGEHRHEGLGVTLQCDTHMFGRLGLAEDLRRVRAADVLVGMHGAGLTNAFFMRRRSALVEVRPYGFDGLWPDSYFRNMLRLARPQKIFHMLLSIGSPELCHPSHGYAVTAQTASYVKFCKLPWLALIRALRVVVWWRSPGAGPRSKLPPDDRYALGSFASKNLVAYASDELDRNATFRRSRAI